MPANVRDENLWESNHHLRRGGGGAVLKESRLQVHLNFFLWTSFRLKGPSGGKVYLGRGLIYGKSSFLGSSVGFISLTTRWLRRARKEGARRCEKKERAMALNSPRMGVFSSKMAFLATRRKVYHSQEKRRNSEKGGKRKTLLH